MHKFSRTRRPIFALVGAIIAALAGSYIWTQVKFDIPFVKLDKQSAWEIEIYSGDSPFDLTSREKIGNPVLVAADVTDVPAVFVADPFMVKEGSTWYMFFEILNKATNQGDIGLATSDNGFDWRYRSIVLDEPFHLSYPHVFKWEGEYYMIPESRLAKAVKLYKSTDFPTRWSFVKDLLHGTYVDPTVFHFNGMWWMFVSPTQNRNSTLRLFYADSLFGPWVEHPKSPIVKENAHIARPAGKILEVDGRMYRFAQDDEPRYGIQVYAFEILELTTETYSERMVGKEAILRPSQSFFKEEGIHQIDAHQIGKGDWIAAIDYRRERWKVVLEF